MQFPCPMCKRTVDVPDKYAGQQASCAYCGNTITAPQPHGQLRRWIITGVIVSAVGLAMVVVCPNMVRPPGLSSFLVLFGITLTFLPVIVYVGSGGVHNSAKARSRLESDSQNPVATTTQQAQEPRQQLTAQQKGCVAGCAYLVIALAAIMTQAMTSHSQRNTRFKRDLGSMPPYGTAQRLQYEVKEALGSSNRNIQRVFGVRVHRTSIHVLFAINDNLSDSMVIRSAKHDIEKALQAIQSSGYSSYSSLYFVGTFSLEDKYGNSREGHVIRVYHKRIRHPSGLLTENFPADSTWIRSVPF